MKRNNVSKKRSWLLLLCLLSIMVFLTALTSQAASTKTKAMKAYTKMLSKKNLKRDDYTVYKTKNCYFSIAYIDNDSVPELIVYNTKDASHIQGWGALYTYRNGKVRYVSSMMLDGKKRLGYYKKTGWFMDNTTYQGWGSDYFQKLSKAKISTAVSYEREVYNGKATGTYIVVKKGSYKNIKAATFKRELKKNTKNKKLTKYKFYKNTSANRKKYLK